MDVLELLLKRLVFTADSTFGSLYVNGKFHAFTCEDVYRGNIAGNPSLKVHGKTAIDYGRYEVIVSYSNRFKTWLPEILKVPQFSGIRMHGGNTNADTLGCILLAKHSDMATKIWECKAVVQSLTDLIKNAGSCWITIVGEDVV